MPASLHYGPCCNEAGESFPKSHGKVGAGASGEREVRERLERKKCRTSTPKGHEEVGAGRASVPEGHEEVGAEVSDGRKATKRLVLKLAMDEGARTGTTVLALKLTTGERARTGTATPALSLAWPKITIKSSRAILCRNNS